MIGRINYKDFVSMLIFIILAVLIMLLLFYKNELGQYGIDALIIVGLFGVVYAAQMVWQYRAGKEIHIGVGPPIKKDAKLEDRRGGLYVAVVIGVLSLGMIVRGMFQF